MTIEYREYAVPERLQSVVERLWTLRAGALPAAEPIVSDGSVELVFNCGEPIEEQRPDRRSPVRQPVAAIVGPTIRPILVRPTGSMDCVGIRVRPAAVAAFLGMPAAELRDGTYRLEDVIARTSGLAECVAAAAPTERIAILLRWLASRPQQVVDSRLDALTARLRRQPVDRVTTAARTLGISARTLERLCRSEIGLTAKELLRVFRIQRVLASAAAEPLTRWSALAMQCGYYDQSHFVHEFRELVGTTPSEYRAHAGTLTDTIIQQEL